MVLIDRMIKLSLSKKKRNSMESIELIIHNFSSTLEVKSFFQILSKYMSEIEMFRLDVLTLQLNFNLPLS